jgi:hypothetical protein
VAESERRAIGEKIREKMDGERAAIEAKERKANVASNKGVFSQESGFGARKKQDEGDEGDEKAMEWDAGLDALDQMAMESTGGSKGGSEKGGSKGGSGEDWADDDDGLDDYDEDSGNDEDGGFADEEGEGVFSDDDAEGGSSDDDDPTDPLKQLTEKERRKKEKLKKKKGEGKMEAFEKAAAGSGTTSILPWDTVDKATAKDEKENSFGSAKMTIKISKKSQKARTLAAKARAAAKAEAAANGATGQENDSEEEEEEDEGPGPVHVLPLFARLPSNRQLAVFQPLPTDQHRLIVVATNVAETSITIPGIRYVIDSGRAKEKKVDVVTGVASFEVGWVAKASAEQRKGRAGRVGPGHCYRLFSSAVFADEENFPPFAAPEVARRPLSDVVLHMKALGVPTICRFPFPTPPPLRALRGAVWTLRMLGALKRLPAHGAPSAAERQKKQRQDKEVRRLKRLKAGDEAGDEEDEEDEDWEDAEDLAWEDGLVLTSLGRGIGRFPVDPAFGRMLIAGVTLERQSPGENILSLVVALVAALSLESPLLWPDREVERHNSTAATPGDAKNGRSAFGGGASGPKGVSHTEGRSVVPASYRKRWGEVLTEEQQLEIVVAHKMDLQGVGPDHGGEDEDEVNAAYDPLNPVKQLEAKNAQTQAKLVAAGVGSFTLEQVAKLREMGLKQKRSAVARWLDPQSDALGILKVRLGGGGVSERARTREKRL